MIPCKGVYRVRLRRFEGTCSESVGLVRLGLGGPSAQRLASIAIFSVSLSMRSHMFVSCSITPSVLVGADWAAEDEDDTYPITGAKYSFTGACAARAAPRKDDTTSGISLTIGWTGKSTIRRSARQNAQERAPERSLIRFQRFALGSVAQKCAVEDAPEPPRLSLPRTEEEKCHRSAPQSVQARSAPGSAQ